MIFYIALLKWRRFEVHYTSWMHYHPKEGVKNSSRLMKVHFPNISDNIVNWNDPVFGIEGTWEAMTAPLQSRIFESNEGYIQWNCIQPSSVVDLRINNEQYKGSGYVEQLVITISPWKVPMDSLRWGRFSAQKINMVWIELRTEKQQQWLWFNGKAEPDFFIDDDQISIFPERYCLKLDKRVVLESEKKILHIVKRLISYLPGLNKSIPIHFLMADECKWLSYGILQKDGEALGEGWVIHELVNFKVDSDDSRS